MSHCFIISRTNICHGSYFSVISYESHRHYDNGIYFEVMVNLCELSTFLLYRAPQIVPITIEIHSCTSGYKIDYRLHAILEQSITQTKLNYSKYIAIFLFNYYSLVVECLCTRNWNKSGPQEASFYKLKDHKCI